MWATIQAYMALTVFLRHDLMGLQNDHTPAEQQTLQKAADILWKRLSATSQAHITKLLKETGF